MLTCIALVDDIENMYHIYYLNYSIVWPYRIPSPAQSCLWGRAEPNVSPADLPPPGEELYVGGHLQLGVPAPGDGPPLAAAPGHQVHPAGAGAEQRSCTAALHAAQSPQCRGPPHSEAGQFRGVNVKGWSHVHATQRPCRRFNAFVNLYGSALGFSERTNHSPCGCVASEG